MKRKFEPLAPLYPGERTSIGHAWTDSTGPKTRPIRTPGATSTRSSAPPTARSSSGSRPSKPMILAEVASTGTRAAKADWIRNMFSELAPEIPSHPRPDLVQPDRPQHRLAPRHLSGRRRGLRQGHPALGRSGQHAGTGSQPDRAPGLIRPESNGPMRPVPRAREVPPQQRSSRWLNPGPKEARMRERLPPRSRDRHRVRARPGLLALAGALAGPSARSRQEAAATAAVLGGADRQTADRRSPALGHERAVGVRATGSQDVSISPSPRPSPTAARRRAPLHQLPGAGDGDPARAGRHPDVQLGLQSVPTPNSTCASPTSA